MENLENLSALMANFGHDVGHPRLNNRSLVNNLEEMASVYNDISVLENMHASITFNTI